MIDLLCTLYLFLHTFQEGEMPIEELLAMYNCVTPSVQTFTPSGSGSKRRSKTSRNAGLDKTLMPPPETPKTIAETSTSNERVKDDVKSEDAATAETDNKPNANAESAETASTASTATSTATETPSPSASTTASTTASSTADTPETPIKTEENTDKDDHSNDTAKSKHEHEPNDTDAAGNVECNRDASNDIDTSQTTSKTSDIQEESTESNTSDKENNAKDDNKTNSDATDSGHANSPSTKVSIDIELNKNKGKLLRLIWQNKKSTTKGNDIKQFADFPDDEDDSKPRKTDSIKAEQNIKKTPNDDEAMDETHDEG